MTDIALPGSIEPARRKGPDLDRGYHPLQGILVMGVVAAALLFVAYSVYTDVGAADTRIATFVPYILLFVALLIALGFEFVNGFHDTANAVATVIYTRSLPAHVAVVWSGFSIFSAFCFRPARSRLASYRCCRSSSFSKSAAVRASPWCLPC